eukprot:Pompholyxophrys_punicea_v1_NODE_275_length_2422_cov_4.596958.p1 type:complete len:553 gc:universal NODE_275_length_2422_cov_4.596958:752-2410(+)
MENIFGRQTGGRQKEINTAENDCAVLFSILNELKVSSCLDYFLKLGISDAVLFQFLKYTGLESLITELEKQFEKQSPPFAIKQSFAFARRFSIRFFEIASERGTISLSVPTVTAATVTASPTPAQVSPSLPTPTTVTTSTSAIPVDLTVSTSTIQSQSIPDIEPSDFSATWICQHHHTTKHDIFISYRVASDKTCAQKLFWALSSSRKETGWSARPFLDKYCLVHGESWENGFVYGLGSSLMVVLLISERGIQPIEKAHERQDNVLLEIEFALARSEAGDALVCPVFLSDENGKRFSFPPLTNFPDVKHRSSRSKTNRTIRQTMEALFRIHGKFVSPDELEYESSVMINTVDEFERKLLENDTLVPSIPSLEKKRAFFIVAEHAREKHGAFLNLKSLFESFDFSLDFLNLSRTPVNQILMDVEMCDLLVSDLTLNHPDIVFCLAIRQSFGKPYVVIKSKTNEVFFDRIPAVLSSVPILDLEDFDFQAELKKVVDKIQFLDKRKLPMESAITATFGCPVSQISPAAGIAYGYFRNFLIPMMDSEIWMQHRAKQ